MLKDADIREPLFDFLETTYGKTRILEELNIASSRADVVMITDGYIFGVEIKSDADSYTRLPSQIKDYDKFFDKNIIVVGSKHAMHVEEHVPESWGIIVVELVDGAPDFYMLRNPKLNTKNEIKNKLSLLWRFELVQIQEKEDMPKYAQKSKAFVVEKIAERVEYPVEKKGHIDLKRLNYQITDILFERDYNTVGDIILQYRKEHSNKPVRARRKKRRRCKKKV